MKLILAIWIAVLLLGKADDSFSQAMNWENLKSEEKHIININTGIEYGFIYGVGYGYQLNFKIPAIVNAEYSFPSGENVFDDFKLKIGIQASVYRKGHFQLSVKAHGVFRHYRSDFVSLINFGSDISVTMGHYRKKWFIGGEFGIDKAIVTHFKHSGEYKSLFPSVKDGWYEPATGGNFYYGLQTGFSFKRNDITMKIGKIEEQNFKSDPIVPIYLLLGYNLRISTFRN
jgi:hypothetical protein